MKILTDEEIFEIHDKKTNSPMNEFELTLYRAIEAAIFEKLMKRAGVLPASRVVREVLATLFVAVEP